MLRIGALVTIACVANVFFPFPGGEIEKANECAWGEQDVAISGGVGELNKEKILYSDYGGRRAGGGGVDVQGGRAQGETCAGGGVERGAKSKPINDSPTYLLIQVSPQHQLLKPIAAMIKARTTTTTKT